MKIISKKKKKKETERDKGFYFIYPRCWHGEFDPIYVGKKYSLCLTLKIPTSENQLRKSQIYDCIFSDIIGQL